MESDSESEKTYATLENVAIEPIDTTNYQLQFEQFVVAERSDDETEDEEVGDEQNQDEDLDDEIGSNLLDDEIGSPLLDDGIGSPLMDDTLDGLDNSLSPQNCILKNQDAKIIESCGHAELKNLLLLNRSKNFMLMQLLKKVRDLLITCRSDISSLNKTTEKINGDHQNMVLSRLAAPYFKTKKNMFSSEPNADILTKRQNGELSIYQNVMGLKWSRNECDNLISGVKMTYNHNKQKTLLRRISSLRFKLDREKEDSVEALKIIQEIDRLEEELRDVNEFQKGEVPPLGQDDFIDWEHISSEYLREKHSAFECRAFWHIYLHPDINKTNWEPDENLKILQLVDKYKCQDWDQIALELMNNRSGFSVYLHYVSVLCEQFCKLRFTKEEDQKILEYVERLKIGSYIPWNAIEAHFPHRSRFQLMHRYKYFLSEKTDAFGTFTDAEDILILILVDRFGRSYAKFKPYIPNRSYMQIKYRYDSHLRQCGTKGNFTLGEDHTLMKYMASQKFKNLGGIATLMNRNRGQLRQRYKTLKTFLEKNPNASLADAPRRNLKKGDVSRRYEFLKYISDQFKNHDDVPRLEDIEERLGVKSKIKHKKRSKHLENSNIDYLLINYFSDSYKLKQKPIDTTVHKIKEAANAIFQILLKWKVKLDIPEELKKNSHLDIVDLEILNTLRDNYQQLNIDASAVDDLIPPNWNTIIGLRGLLLKNNLYKRMKNKSKVTLLDELPLIRNNSDHNLVSELIDMLKDMNANTRNQIEIERCFFLERFMSLFMWPAIFSLQSPSETLLNIELGVKPKESNVEPQEKICKKRKRAVTTSKNVSEKQEVKKAKLITEVREPETRSAENRTGMTLRPRKSITRFNDSYHSEDEIKPCVSSQKKAIVDNIKINTIGSTEPESSHSDFANSEQQTKSTKILKIVKVNDVLKENESQEQITEVPVNLRKVEKSEIDNMLKNKKPVKMFMIQKIKMKDGTFKIVRKPYNVNALPTHSNQNIQKKIGDDANKSVKSQNLVIKKQLTGASIVDVVSFAESVKKEYSMPKSEDNTDNTSQTANNSNPVDIEQLNFVLKDNIKTYSKQLSSKLSHSSKVIANKTNSPPINSARKNMKVLKIRVTKKKESRDKINNVKPDDSIIDLTGQVIKNEKELSNDLTEYEDTFDCF
ncbi:hypothetical protein WA026_015071 [Henosepilachna vigintioctopunctata]|uniref:snRNA-activating protein complex subunit 4 n=1 Tax=Henosepilachna vigintioctopunctata TaxID=420089 RepID=A0AAW1U2W7_9CUCU